MYGPSVALAGGERPWGYPLRPLRPTREHQSWAELTLVQNLAPLRPQLPGIRHMGRFRGFRRGSCADLRAGGCARPARNSVRRQVLCKRAHWARTPTGDVRCSGAGAGEEADSDRAPEDRPPRRIPRPQKQSVFTAGGGAMGSKPTSRCAEFKRTMPGICQKRADVVQSWGKSDQFRARDWTTSGPRLAHVDKH